MDKVEGLELYLGNSQDAVTAVYSSARRKGKITAVVNLAINLTDPAVPNIKSIKVGLVDGRHEEQTAFMYALAARTILDLLDNGDTVLAHCHEGRSRTAAIAIIVLAIKKFGATKGMVETKDNEALYKTILLAKEDVIKTRPRTAYMNKEHEMFLIPALKIVLGD